MWTAIVPGPARGGGAERGGPEPRPGSALSSAQLRVLRAVAEARQNKQIAWDLKLAEPTVTSHPGAIFRELGASNRTQAVPAFRMFDGAGEAA